ncbi:MAG: hypothetical protein IKU57_04295 [Oscillospiraceae bacterium]|nr:hypothetical protein [Oscillospiraceae bacterium]
MFSNIKKLGGIAVTVGTANTLMGVFILTFISNLKLNFAQTFSISVYIVTLSVIFLVLGAAFFALGQDLNISTDSTAGEIAKLKKRVEQLENMQ